MNKVTLIGYLGQDPELKHFDSGTAVCEMSLATSERWTDKNNEKQEKTEWHSLKAWGKQAELCEKYLKKGRQVAIEGKLATRSWEDKETGQKRYKTEIIVSNVEFLGKGDGNGVGSGDHKESKRESKSELSDDDIPF